MRNIKIGAIRWDAWYGHNGIPGSVISEVEKTLSPKEYHFRAPFFAKVTDDGKIEVPVYDQEIFDREMAYAVSSGIDYFAFVWYNDDMKKAREMYKNSPYHDKIKMSVVLSGSHSEEIRREMTELLKEDYFMRVDGGRPLIYYFGACREDAKENIDFYKAFCEREGMPIPYTVVLNLGEEDTFSSGADAIGQYGVTGEKGEPFANVRANARTLWDRFKKTGGAFVPTVSMGWHNRPRHDNPTFWANIESPDSWAQYPTGAELKEHLTEALAYLNEPDTVRQTPAETLLMYAWNEHDEGGWFCPTIAVDENGKQILAPDGTLLANTERLDGVREAIKTYREV